MRNVTAQVMGDPTVGRSALDGYQHIGTIDAGHRIYSDAERKERKYKAKRVRGRTKLREGFEE